MLNFAQFTIDQRGTTEKYKECSGRGLWMKHLDFASLQRSVDDDCSRQNHCLLIKQKMYTYVIATLHICCIVNAFVVLTLRLFMPYSGLSTICVVATIRMALNLLIKGTSLLF